MPLPALVLAALLCCVAALWRRTRTTPRQDAAVRTMIVLGSGALAVGACRLSREAHGAVA